MHHKIHNQITFFQDVFYYLTFMEQFLEVNSGMHLIIPQKLGFITPDRTWGYVNERWESWDFSEVETYKVSSPGNLRGEA